MQQPINTGKAVPVHMKACMGGVGIAPLILNFGTIWRDITPRPLYSRRKNLWHLLNTRLVGSGRSGQFGEY